MENNNLNKDKFAIDFANWIPDNAYKQNTWKMYGKNGKEFTIEELLEIYKKQIK